MADEKTIEDYPVLAEKTVQHGLFWYYKPEMQVINGEERLQLIQHTAFSGEKIQLHMHSDLERGERHGAFLPAGASIAQSGELVPPQEEETEVELSSLDHEDLVDWLMGTGMFDGQKKPTAAEVVTAAEGDPALAKRLLDAEQEASGGEPRKQVREGLEKTAAESE